MLGAERTRNRSYRPPNRHTLLQKGRVQVLCAGPAGGARIAHHAPRKLRHGQGSRFVDRTGGMQQLSARGARLGPRLARAARLLQNSAETLPSAQSRSTARSARARRRRASSREGAAGAVRCGGAAARRASACAAHARAVACLPGATSSLPPPAPSSHAPIARRRHPWRASRRWRRQEAWEGQ